MTREEITALIRSWPGGQTREITRLIQQSWSVAELETAIAVLRAELFAKPRRRPSRELDRICDWINRARSRHPGVRKEVSHER